jgi:hypothetical protein
LLAREAGFFAADAALEGCFAKIGSSLRRASGEEVRASLL